MERLEKTPATELAAINEVLKQLLSGQKDHETRIRKIEYFTYALVGAGGLYKFLIAS